ncbi:MAG: sensor histidine kinase [Alphaproteobacteria bacterium]|nr:sensor histidine kinase [Alphaproteobacteria bacterium]
MTNGPDGKKNPVADQGRGLRPQLFFYLTLALLPIAAVSIVQGIERVRIDTANVHERLIQSALAAAADENRTLASAERLLQTVAGFEEVRRMTPACDYALSVAFGSSRNVSNLARLDSSGKVVCAALSGARNRSAAGTSLFRAAMTANGIVFSDETWSPVLKRQVMAAMLPLRDAHGRFAGAVAAAFDVDSLDRLLRARILPKGAVIALFDRTGTVLASNEVAVARPIFGRAPSAPADQNRLETGKDTNGDLWTYVTTPLMGNSVFVGYAMPETKLFSTTRLHVGTDFALPILMIAAAWLAIWYATDRLVSRWILYLRRIASSYRSGHYAVRPALDQAPQEFKLLGEALAEMAEAVQDRDQRLRDALDQKSTLVREVHHRVKNNLQIVMSLLSLQTGQLRDPAARHALTQAQVRINALALVHRILHEIEDKSTVELKRLIEELTQQVSGGLGTESQGLRIETDILERSVTGELAVPLALFTVEALTNIFKHAYPAESGAAVIRVSLKEIGAGRLRLAVEDNGVGFDSETAPERTSIGSRLIHTFGVQVGGTSSIRSSAGAGTVVELIFPDPAQKPQSKASAA